MDTDFDLVLAKACDTTHGRLKAQFVLAELNKMAPAYHDENTREAAEEALTKWADLGDDLRKGLALAWLDRARAALAPAGNAVAAAAGAVKGAAHAATAPVRRASAAVEQAVGTAGASAGKRFANSTFNAGRKAAIENRGGAIARDRLAARMLRQNPRRNPMLLDPIEGTHPGMLQHEATPGPRLEPQPDPLDAAFRAGAAHAGERHAAAMTRLGRVAAVHAYKVGRTVAATGAGLAVAGAASRHLSAAEHEERVNAGKHSHQRAGAV